LKPNLTDFPNIEYDEDFSAEFWQAIRKFNDWKRYFEKRLRAKQKHSAWIEIKEILGQ